MPIRGHGDSHAKVRARNWRRIVGPRIAQSSGRIVSHSRCELLRFIDRILPVLLIVGSPTDAGS